LTREENFGSWTNRHNGNTNELKDNGVERKQNEVIELQRTCERWTKSYFSRELGLLEVIRKHGSQPRELLNSLVEK